MSECTARETLRQQGSPCPYCHIDKLKAAMIDLAKNISNVDQSRLQPRTTKVWGAVVCEDAFK